MATTETQQNPLLAAMGLTAAAFKLQVQAATIQELQQKLIMLRNYKRQLQQQSEINVMAASEQEIMQAIEEKTRKSTEAKYVDSLIEQIEISLKEKVSRQNQEVFSANAEENWRQFEQLGIQAQQKMAEAIALIQKMQKQSNQLSSSHYSIYGQYILDYRLATEYQFPKIEKVGKSFIIHNEHMPMI